MRLYEEIYREYTGAGCAFTPKAGGYFQGVKTLGSFSKTEIELIFSWCKVVVKGEELGIKKYCDEDVEISGKIRAVEVVGE